MISEFKPRKINMYIFSEDVTYEPTQDRKSDVKPEMHTCFYLLVGSSLQGVPMALSGHRQH